jgi:cold shock CspA family protein
MKRGYGFITRLSDGNEFFVPRSLIILKEDTTYVPKLYDGEYVEFTVDEKSMSDQKKLPRVKQVRGPMGYPLRVDHMCERRKQRPPTPPSTPSPPELKSSTTQTETQTPTETPE